MKNSIELEVKIELDDLVDYLCQPGSLGDYEEETSKILDFIMKIDTEMQDLDFTVQLRDRLNKVIEHCEMDGNVSEQQTAIKNWRERNGQTNSTG